MTTTGVGRRCEAEECGLMALPGSRFCRLHAGGSHESLQDSVRRMLAMSVLRGVIYARMLEDMGHDAAAELDLAREQAETVADAFRAALNESPLSSSARAGIWKSFIARLLNQKPE